jgi:hypothetical protein
MFTMLGLKKRALVLGVLLLLLSACGGGGDSSAGSGSVSASETTSSSAASSSGSTAAVSSASFKVSDSVKQLFAGPSSSFGLGAVTVKFEGKGVGLFEGQSAQQTELSIAWNTKEVSAPEDKVQRFSFYFGVDSFVFMGTHDPSDASYEVATATWTLPDSVKIGTTGPVATSLVYRDADKKEVIAEGRVDYSVEQEPTSNSDAWVCLIFTESDPTSHVRQSVSRLCSLVEDTGWAGKGIKLEFEEFDSAGNSLGLIRLF